MPPPPQAGRPQEIFIDAITMEKVAGTGATQKEIAAHFNCSISSLEGYLRNDTVLREAYERGVDKMNVKLRSAQLSVAIQDRNPSMLIWLGKVRLGQRDNVDERAREAAAIAHLTSPERLEIMAELYNKAQLNKQKIIEGTCTEVKP